MQESTVVTLWMGKSTAGAGLLYAGSRKALAEVGRPALAMGDAAPLSFSDLKAG